MTFGTRLGWRTQNDLYHTTDCYNSAYNVYSGDVNFGSASSDLRWVWLYTCNFLTTSEYVTDASLKEMMTGVHIVMGYASKATMRIGGFGYEKVFLCNRCIFVDSVSLFV